jgi:hypothetical protein
MKAMNGTDRYVIGRESNVLRVDFHREPEQPPPRFPRFPGAGALRYQEPFSERVDAVTPFHAASGQCC